MKKARLLLPSSEIVSSRQSGEVKSRAATASHTQRQELTMIEQPSAPHHHPSSLQALMLTTKSLLHNSAATTTEPSAPVKLRDLKQPLPPVTATTTHPQEINVPIPLLFSPATPPSAHTVSRKSPDSVTKASGMKRSQGLNFGIESLLGSSRRKDVKEEDRKSLVDCEDSDDTNERKQTESERSDHSSASKSVAAASAAAAAAAAAATAALAAATCSSSSSTSPTCSTPPLLTAPLPLRPFPSPLLHGLYQQGPPVPGLPGPPGRPPAPFPDLLLHSPAAAAMTAALHLFPPHGHPGVHAVHPHQAAVHAHHLAAAAVAAGKRKKSWTRAVFSNLQRKGLEKRFQIQKYITKPDRRQLAASLGLTDAQVKVWFQNRRMKWRHQESKERREQERAAAAAAAAASATTSSSSSSASTTVSSKSAPSASSPPSSSPFSSLLFGSGAGAAGALALSQGHGLRPEELMASSDESSFGDEDDAQDVAMLEPKDVLPLDGRRMLLLPASDSAVEPPEEIKVD